MGRVRLFQWLRPGPVAAAAALVLAQGAVAATKPPPSTRTVTVTASVAILKPLTLATGLALTSGSVATTTTTASGTETIPASFPTLSTPAVSYAGTKLAAISGKTTQPAAARIDLTGVAGTSVTVRVTGWTVVSGATPAPTLSATSVYSPSYGTKTAPVVVLDAKGKGSLYVGATLTVPAGATARVYNFSPIFSVNYN